MECLDQINSNLVSPDRASTAALSHSCPACDNQNARGSNTDNDPTTRHLVHSPSTHQAPACSCSSTAPSANHASHSTSPGDPNPEPSPRTSGTLTPLSSTPIAGTSCSNSMTASTTTMPHDTPLSRLSPCQPDVTDRWSDGDNLDLPATSSVSGSAFAMSLSTSPSGLQADSDCPLTSQNQELHNANSGKTPIPCPQTDSNVDTMAMSSDPLPPPSSSSSSSPTHPHHHHKSEPIPIRPQCTRRYQRHRHHNDSDLTQGSLTPSRNLDLQTHWSAGSPSCTNPPIASSPGDRSALHFYSQQSPKYFRQTPVTSLSSPLSSRAQNTTTPTGFTHWTRKTSDRTQHHASRPTTEKATTPTSNSQGLWFKPTETGTTPTSSSQGLWFKPSKADRLSCQQRVARHHSRWRSRGSAEGDWGDEDRVTPMDTSRAGRGSDRVGGHPSECPVPQGLRWQLQGLQHHNEDLSAEVVSALGIRGFFIHEVLGKGISSTVRRVTEKKSGQEFAVKIIDISGEKGDVDVVDQLKKDTVREIRVLRLCGVHQNIIELHDVFETSTFIFLVFELCRQGELFDYLTSVVSLSEKRTRIIMRQLLEAVQFIHENNIVHRDLKPENILLDDDLNIKVSDFGFATVVEKGEELSELCGTPGYLAPEVLAHSMYENVPGYGKEVDMWACGVIMYTLLCGAPPFWNRRQMMMLRAIMNADYHFNSPEWDDISDQPKNLIQKLLLVNPKDRLTAREALSHPFFHSKLPGSQRFQARRKFRASVFCVIFYRRLAHFYQHPPPISMDTLATNPYSIKFIRKAIDNCAFSIYRHWVKRVDNQNRAALFEHTLRDEWRDGSTLVLPSTSQQ